MVLLKFKAELPPPAAPPSLALSQLIKTNLRYPESHAHSFTQNRWEPLAHTGFSALEPIHRGIICRKHLAALMSIEQSYDQTRVFEGITAFSCWF